MQIPGLTMGIVADDLTGANDTALQFFMKGSYTQVLPDPENLPEPAKMADPKTQVWSINSDSRHLDVRDAISVVRQSVEVLKKHCGVENFYKKIDSTLRGHVAHECLAVLDELKWDCAVIAPAFPSQGRRTVGGYQLIRGMPLEQTDVARDPLFPIRQSHVPTILSASSRPELVGHVELSTVLHGAGPLVAELKELVSAGKKLIVVDACSDTDLEQIALALEKLRKSFNILPCGSGGLAQALSRYWCEECEPPALPVEFPAQPILMTLGSASDATRTQVFHLIENAEYYTKGTHLEVFNLEPEVVLGQAPVEPLLEKIIAALGDKNNVILSSALKEGAVAKTQELAEAAGIPREKIPLMVQDLLGEMTQKIYAVRPVQLVVAGGETAARVCHASGMRSLTVTAEVEPAIPLLQDEQGRWLVTKSGSFGTPKTIANVLRYLREHEVSAVK